MALFPRTVFQPESNFTPLFRLLDDFDAYTGRNAGDGHRRHGSHFQPKFDVREVADAYELHGELPGMSKDDVHVEFTDAQTLNVRGRVERSYASGTPPAALLEETKKSGTITEAGEEEGGKKATTETSGDNEHKAKYWVAERSIGEFSRTFNFPHAVQQDGVTASFKDGILTLIIPKAKNPTGRRIEIQ